MTKLFWPEGGDGEFSEPSQIPGRARGQKYEEQVRTRINPEKELQCHCEIRLEKSARLSEDDRIYLQKLHAELHQLSEQSVGRERWDKIHGPLCSTDKFRAGSCDIIVGLGVSIYWRLGLFWAKPLYGNRWWRTSQGTAAVEVTQNSALLWMKIYQLERFLLLCGASAARFDSGGIVINSKPLQCQWDKGWLHFRENGPVKQLAQRGKFHIIHLPMSMELNDVETLLRKVTVVLVILLMVIVLLAVDKIVPVAIGYPWRRISDSSLSAFQPEL